MSETDIEELSHCFTESLVLQKEAKIQCNKLKTEDTGKMFEMAICKALNITYNGKYKYDMHLADKLYPRLQKLSILFPKCTHTAKAGSPYDFTSIEEPKVHLSAKTCKKGQAKVAPQVIGQATPEKLCNILQIQYTTDENLKMYIQNNIIKMLQLMTHHTFNCTNIYFHQQKGTIKLIKLHTPIDWNNYTYNWTRNWKDWNNSTTCKIVTETKIIPIAEFQLHKKNRTNMAIRFSYDKILEIFKSHFEIIHL